MTPSRWKIGIALVVGVLASAAILVTGPASIESAQQAAKPVVSLAALERASVPKEHAAYGRLGPRQSLQLAAQVSGEVVWVNPKLQTGYQVAENEALLRIDESDFVVATNRARASYAMAQADIALEQGRSEIAQMEWQVWQSESAQELAASPLAVRKPQQAQAQARLDVMRAELAAAQLALSRAKLRAPWPAAVIQANTVKGQLLRAGDSAATLFPIDFALVDVQVPPQLLPQLERGLQSIELRPAYDLLATPVQGSLDAILRSLGADNRLATLRVRVEQPLENPGWTFGMHLQARLVADEQQAIARIPQELVVGGNLVWIYRNGVALRHQVFPLSSALERVLVVDNFEKHDRLIVKRPIGLFEGAEVSADEA